MSGAVSRAEFELREYEALRAEMNRRGSVRYQILLAVYTLLAALFTLQFGTAAQRFPAVLLFPFLQYPFAALWAHNYRRTVEVSDYIADGLEAQIGGGWETRMQAARRSSGAGSGRLVSATAAGAQFSICGSLCVVIGIGTIIAERSADPLILLAGVLGGATVAVTAATVAAVAPRAR